MAIPTVVHKGDSIYLRDLPTDRITFIGLAWVSNWEDHDDLKQYEGVVWRVGTTKDAKTKKDAENELKLNVKANIKRPFVFTPACD